MKELIVSTDGSALENPTGAAGWAWYVDEENWDYGGLEVGSNQLAEVLAICQALHKIPKDVPLRIQTDSKFWINVVGEDGKSGWRKKWKSNGWIKADGKPPANLKAVKTLDKLLLERTAPTALEWVKGHSDHVLNQIADKLCTHASFQMKNYGRQVKGPGWGSNKLYSYELPTSVRKIVDTNANAKPIIPAKKTVKESASKVQLSKSSVPQAKTRKQSESRPPQKGVRTGKLSRQEVERRKSKNPVGIQRQRTRTRTQSTTKQGYKKAVLNPPTASQRKKAETAAQRKSKPAQRRQKAAVDNSVVDSFYDDSPIPTVTKKVLPSGKAQYCPACGGPINPDTSECRCSF